MSRPTACAFGGADLGTLYVTTARFRLAPDKLASETHAGGLLALDVGVKDGRIKPGDLVMIEAMGGGFTWGAALIRW